MNKENHVGAQSLPRSRRRRLRKIVLYLFAAFVVVVLLAALGIRMFLTEERVKNLISTQAGAALDREVTVGSADLDLFSGIKIGDLRIANKEGFAKDDLFRVKQVDVRVDVWRIVTSFGRKIHVRADVTEPRVLIERNAAGVLNIADLLKPKEKKPPTPLDELSLDVKVAGAEVVFRDEFGGTRRTTELKNVDFEATLPAIDQALTYRLTADVGDGSVRAEGSPKLFHEGVVDPAHVRGELVRATVADLPLDAICGLLGLPPTLRSMDGTLAVSVDDAGKLVAKSSVSGTTAFEGLGFKVDAGSTADLAKLDATAKVVVDLLPFSRAAFDLDVKNGGSGGLRAVLDFTGDLAKLTGSEAARSLGMPLAPDGSPLTSNGRIAGRVEITGTPAELTSDVVLSVDGFQAHPSLTGGKTLPPEDTRFEAKAVLHAAPDGKPDSVEIPLIKAESSFLEASVTDGKVSSLSDLKNLAMDFSGHVRFSGRAFSGKFGKALGLPEVFDEIEATFSGKGESGRADLAADAILAREEGPREPVTLSFRARLDASGPKVNLADCELGLQAGDGAAPYAHCTVRGGATDLAGTPDVDLAFDASADLEGLASRLSAYVNAIAKLAPRGAVVVKDGRFRGGPQKFAVAFKLAASDLAVEGGPDGAPESVRPALDVLSQDELLCLCDLTADLGARRVEIKALDLKSSFATGVVTGTVEDYAALKGALDIKLDATTDKLGAVLAAMKLIPEGIDTTGRITLAGRIDTAAGRADLATLDARTPYLEMRLKDKLSLTGLDVDKLRADPIAAAKGMSGKAVFEGAVLLDALARLPEGLVPAGLSASGRIPFTLTARRASPGEVALSVDATDAAVRYGDMFAKPAGSKAKLSLNATLTEAGGVDVPAAGLLMDGVAVRFAGSVDKEFETVTCREFTAKVDRTETLAAMAPVLAGSKLTGGVDVSASGSASIGEIASGKLDGVDFKGRADFREVEGRYEQMPGLAFKVNGSVQLGRDAVDASGLAVTATNIADRKGATVTFEKLRVTAAEKGTPLFARPDALHLEFLATSPDVNAGDLLAALPKKDTVPGTGGGPAAPGTAEPKAVDLGFLRNHEADGRIVVDKLTYEKHVVTNLSGEFQMRGNKVTTPKPAHAETLGGTVDADLKIDLDAPAIAHQGTIKITKMDINKATAAQLSLDDVFRGEMNGDMTWQGSGFSMQDISKSWTGAADLAVNDGVVLNFERSPLLGLIAGPILKHLGASAFPGNQFQYDRLGVKARLEQGRVRTDDMLLEGANDLDVAISNGSFGLDGTIQGDAAVEVPVAMAMDYIGKHLTKQETALNVIEKAMTEKRPSFCSFGVGGSFGDPDVSFKLTILDWAGSLVGDMLRDPGGLIKDILKEGVEKELEKRGKEGEKSDKEKAIEGIIKGIFD